MVDDAEFARRIRMVRAYLNLTLADAGKMLDISPSQLSKRENADVNGLKFRPADRLFMATVYAELAGWPLEFFSDQNFPSTIKAAEDDPLDPLDVVESVRSTETESRRAVRGRHGAR